MNPKILFTDIETSPNVGYTWGKYEQDVIQFQKEWEVLSVAWKWEGHETQVIARDTRSELQILKAVRSLLHQAEVVVAQNGDAFDIKKLNTRFLIHRLPPPSPYKTVDTLKVAQARFALTSNKLDDIGKALSEGEKIKHRGFDMWLGCMAGNKADFRDMKTYNKQDVDLLYRIYKRFLPWIKSHPAISVYKDHNCPRCGSTKMQKRGTMNTASKIFDRFQCRSCSGWSRRSTGIPQKRLLTI